MKKQSTLLYLSLCLLLTFLTGCKDEQTAQQAPKEMPPVHVVAVEIKPETLDITGEYMGKALGFLSVEVRAQISGILLKKYYKEGDFVEKGQLLFEIDPSQAEAALSQANAVLAQAESAYNNAKREWDRVLPLYRQNAVSQRDRDQAQAAYLSAKANVEAAKASESEAKIQLAYTKVIAPISGYTSLETKNEGNLITLDSSGSLLTKINQTDPMYITFSFPGTEITRMQDLARKGKAELPGTDSEVSLKLIGGQEYPHKGKLSYTDTQINPLTNSIEARAEFPNPDGGLLPNMFTNISVYGGKLKDVIILPQKAILYTANGSMVYVIDKDNKVALRPIKISFPVNDLFIIESGIEVGEKVVIEGITKAHPGSAVNATMQSSVISVESENLPAQTPEEATPAAQ